jgi:hypothetical protein
MKLIYLSSIGGVMALSAFIYISLNSDIRQEEARNSVEPLLISEKTGVHEVVSKDGGYEDQGENIALLRKEISSLRNEFQSLRADMQAQKSAHKTTSPLGQSNDEQHLAQTNEKENNNAKKQEEAIEVHFKQQTVDPVWSEKTKSLVQDALVSDHVTSKDIVDVECRNSMCRVELANDANSEGLNIEEFPMKVDEELPNIRASHTKTSDGSIATVLYLSKEGFVFPEADN